MSEINVKPKAGIIVRKPDGSPLATKGETVKRNAYWVRRINDGDVEVVKIKDAVVNTVKENK